MTEPDFKGAWKILSSNSRFFSSGSDFELRPKPGDPDSFEVDVLWERHPPVKLVDRVRRLDVSTLEGTFSHPKDPEEVFQLVLTFCPVPGPGGKKRLFGLLNSGRIDGGATGVWVAEEPPKEPPQG